MAKKKLQIVDLFCGTGGFSYGFQQATNSSFETVLGIDLLPVAIETFKANHPTATAICGDIRKLPPKEICESLKIKRDSIDLIIGGPPCQGFSSIRPFRSSSLEDPRNSLFEDFAKYVEFLRPKAIVMENVVGLATFQDGQTINDIEQTFKNLGYVCDWKILNAAHFGIPQRRERLILIGIAKGKSVAFPKPTHFCDEPTIGCKEKSRMLLPPESDLFNQDIQLEQAVSVLDAISDLPAIKSGEEASHYLKPKNDYQKVRRGSNAKVDLHYSTKHTPKMMEIIRHSGANISSIPKHLISSGFSSCYSRLDGTKPAVTITVNFVHPASNRCIHPICDRALTPREGARIQSFDDSFVFAGNRSQIVKQIGNAVPPLLGTILGNHLAEQLT